MTHRIRTPLLAIALSLALAVSALAEDTSLGRVTMPNSGAAEAQEPFLRGLAALHSFWYDEAADLFREAQAADPEFALAYWGEAMTYNHPLWGRVDQDAALEALARYAPTAEERAAKAPTERERAYLATLEALYGEGTKEERDRAYSEAWKRVFEQFPDDDEARAFYALSLQGLPREEDALLFMQSAALMEELFAVNPLHPGAAHYLIHAYDDPVHAPLGLRAAEVYADIAPEANHALHMPSHIFLQLGMWERVVASNIDAWNASVVWVQRRGHPLDKRDYHSLSWEQYAYLQLGRYRQAEECLDKIAPVATDSGNSHLQWNYQAMLARQAIETGQPYTGSLPEGDPDDDHHYNYATIYFAAGYSAVDADDLATAHRMSAQLARLAKSEEGKSKPSALQVLRHSLRAKIEQAAGNLVKALIAAETAVQAELELAPPSGPPDTFKPAHELFGELLLAADQPEEAAEQFRRSLRRTPKRTASLLGAARAASALGDKTAAREHWAQLLENLANADTGHPAVAEARAALATSATPSPAAGGE